jgi:serine/threonine-protein kinase
MTTTELGACEWFVWDLRRSNLVDRGQLDQLVFEFLKKETRAEPPALAHFLIDQGVLTQFQADRLLQGKTQGLVLGPYVLMDVLGTGSMGTVYKAQSRNDSRWYAVKVLPRRSMWNVRIARRQVRAFEQIRHAAVVPFVDVGTAGGNHYLVWPLVEGETLDSLVQHAGKLSPGLAAYYALKVVEGLAACHAQGLIHGLIKPSNLLVGLDQQVRILDFGIGTLLANSEGESLVDTMSTANTLTSGLDCASPESILEPANRTAAGDQYSLGCVLYYCLTGRYPFPEGTAVEKMMAHQTKDPTPVADLAPGVPVDLAALVGRLMAKQPEQRFASTSEVVEALQPLAAAPPPGTYRSPNRAAKPAAATGNGAGLTALEPFELQELGLAGPDRPALHLPTRENLRGGPGPGLASTPLPSSPGLRPAPVRFQPVPFEPEKSLDERVGPIGLIAGAIVAAALTWVLSMWLFR